MDNSNPTTEEANTSDASQGVENPSNNSSKKGKVEGAKNAPPRARRALPITKKRKAKAIEKSTTTTTTAAVHTPVNVYDAVLGEAEDLLKAAAEAQALGRLKMASAYQLLLHARLVGLAKRFDQAQVLQDASEAEADSPSSNVGSTESSSPVDSGLHSELAKMLPQNVEMDSAMIEHLARAAMELHHQRTGRRIASDSITEPPPKPSSSASIAWTEREKQTVQAALEAGTKDPAVISSKLKTRSEAQVKAYLRNSKERQKGSEQIEEEITFRRGGRGRKPPTQAMNTMPNAKLDARELLSGKGL